LVVFVSTVLSYAENSWFSLLRKDIFGNTLVSFGVQRVE